MKGLNHTFRLFILLFSVSLLTLPGYSQTSGMPEEMNKSSLREQMNYLESKTRIYDNFRAIREDIFQKLKKNVTDSMNLMQKKVNSLNSQTSSLKTTIDSLNSNLNTTRTDLEQMTNSRNSVNFVGMEVDKGTYNTIMWSIVVVLVLLLLVGFLIFRRNQNLVNARNKDLDDLRAEFEAYRKTSRESREKMALQHFNELKKLRGE